MTNTCTTNIVNHVNEVYPGRVPRAIAIFLPGLSPKILYKNNLVKIDTSIDNTLEKSIIDEILALRGKCTIFLVTHNKNLTINNI